MTQWYEHTGLSFLLLIHDFDCRKLSTMLLSNSPSYASSNLLFPMQAAIGDSIERGSATIGRDRAVTDISEVAQRAKEEGNFPIITIVYLLTQARSILKRYN